MSNFNEAEHPRDERGRFTGNGFFYTEEERHEAAKTFSMLTNILTTGISSSVKSKILGEVLIDAGVNGKKGYGLKHIIENRLREGKNIDKITAILYLVIDTVKTGKKNRDIPIKQEGHKGRVELEKNGIIAIISKQRIKGDNEKWLLTGFDSNEKQKEAQDAMQTVSVRYSYAPEYSGFRKQVGAVIASLNILSDKNELLSSIKKAISKIEFKMIKWQLQERFG